MSRPPGVITLTSTAAPRPASRDGRNELWRLFRYVRPYRGRLTVGMLAVAISGLLGLSFPLLIRELLNTAFSPEASATTARALLDRTALLLALLVVAQAGFNYLRTYQLGRVGEAVVADVRKELHSHLLTLPVRFFDERQTGELTSRLTADAATVQAAVSQALAQLINQSVTLVGGLLLLFYLEARLTLVMLSVVPAVAVAAALFGRSLRKVSRRFQDKVAEATAFAGEALSNIRVVKSFNAEPLEGARYGEAIDASFEQALLRVRLRALFVPAVLLFGFSGMGLVLWYGGRLAISGSLQSGDLLAFLLITVFVAGSIGTFTGLFAQLQEAAGASSRIFQLLDLPPGPPEQLEPQPLRGAVGHVALHGVSFSYERGAPPVLKDVTLKASPGEVVALVGPSGAGKSTLVNLIPRFYDPEGGQVTLDGVDLRELRVRELRSLIGMVPQETQLFSGTVRQNLLYGRPDATPEEVLAAATAANAHEFISALPHGYDTPVGERGVKLSGGQRQRVAIARALLKDPRILILDEATSSLDSESEALVQEALETLMGGRTTFVIAHRLATVLGADQIVVLRDGEVVERGTHADLIAARGAYAVLFERQFEAQRRGVSGEGVTPERGQ